MPNILFHRIASSLPGLQTKLLQAGMPDTPEEFVKRTFLSAFYLTTGVLLILLTLFLKVKVVKTLVFFLFPIIFFLAFFYFIRMPDVLILRRKREINKEIVFAGRFLIVELNSGVPLYNAISNVSKNFQNVGKYFKEIVDKVDLGTPIEDAISEAVELTPSANFRRIMWQILNALKTGADVKTSLAVTIDQIVKEQLIEVRDYGRKLNPLAMFYMIIAVIFPSVGIIMLVVASSFLSLKFDLQILIVFAVFIGFLQYMFFNIIKSQRPSVEI